LLDRPQDCAWPRTESRLKLFWCRDYLILRMGPLHEVSSRVGLYSGILLVTIALVSAVSTFIWSFPVLISLIAVQILGALLCLWLKRSDRDHRVWLMALIPAPAVLFFLASGMVSRESIANGFVARLLCALCVIAMFAMVARARRIEMCAEDLDFAVSFAGSSNCLGSFILAFTPLLLQQIA